jgi:hypothetical protein
LRNSPLGRAAPAIVNRTVGPGIAAELAARGYVNEINENGKEFSAASVASMLGT